MNAKNPHRLLRLDIDPVIQRAEQLAEQVRRDLPSHSGLIRAAQGVVEAAREAIEKSNRNFSGGVLTRGAQEELIKGQGRITRAEDDRRGGEQALRGGAGSRGEGVGLLAAGWVAFYPYFIYYSAALMTEMLRPFMPSQKSAFARVAVNDRYLGLYLAVQQVEGDFVAEWFPDCDGILIKGDPPAGPGMGAKTFHSSLEWEGEDLARYRALYEVKTDGAEEDGLRAIREAARVLDAPASEGGVTDADLAEAAERILDVDRALWYLAANNLYVNYDSYYFGHNYFWFLSERDGLLHMLLWDTSLSFGDLELIPDEGKVLRGGEEVHLTKTEFRLLCELAEDPGKVLSREVLLDKVWGYDYFADGRLVDVHVRRLRTKVEVDAANPRHVVTVRGLGYKLQT